MYINKMAVINTILYELFNNKIAITLSQLCWLLYNIDADYKKQYKTNDTLSYDDLIMNNGVPQYTNLCYYYKSYEHKPIEKFWHDAQNKVYYLEGDLSDFVVDEINKYC